MTIFFSLLVLCFSGLVYGNEGKYFYCRNGNGTRSEEGVRVPNTLRVRVRDLI
jgi:hypothetical protein